jgi:hypothetical protein
MMAMDQELYFLNAMNRTKILLPPRHTLATFGSTTLNYVLLSEMPDSIHVSRLRTGKVIAQRPHIITPDVWRKRFEGFGEETETYKGIMDQTFGEALRGLEYTFKNEVDRTSIESSPLHELAQRVKDSMNKENAPRTALLQGPDSAWGLSVMKFIVEMSLRSFPVNLRELQEHDLLDPSRRVENQTRRRIEQLFREAQGHPEAIKRLGETLKETSLFSDYEDRFFALVKSNA